jgi:uncharacterized protein YlzI (FlbEa/FlbD family)
MASRIAGIAWLRVDGQQYPLRGNFTVSPSPLERKMLAGQDYVHGYSEEPRVPFIEGDVSLVPELLIEDVDAVVNATVTAELANGKVYVLKEAVCKSAHELNSKDGLVRVRFEGTSCDEIS